MAAGLGYKEFTTGDVLTAADANGYLASQVVMVFADATARTAAIASPQEGMISFLKDTNATQYYSGSAWVSISAGSTSPLTTKGDVYTYSTTDARIGVGANGTVLTADSVETTGLKWAAPASGLTLITTASPSSSATTNINNCFSATYQNYVILMSVTGTTDANISMRLRASGTDSSTNYTVQNLTCVGAVVTATRDASATSWIGGFQRASGRSFSTINVSNPFAAAASSVLVTSQDPSGGASQFHEAGAHSTATSYDGITFFVTAGSITGSIRVYGVQN
jgi:hypothetical protein